VGDRRERRRPGGQRPQALEQLSPWLARAAGRTGRLEDALTALGFAPKRHPINGADVRYVLGNCPYREAVAQNQRVVCTLHRGMTKGVLDRLDRTATLANFVAKDPYSAGCLIDVTLAPTGPSTTMSRSSNASSPCGSWALMSTPGPALATRDLERRPMPPSRRLPCGGISRTVGR
jgi:hypothetical protein